MKQDTSNKLAAILAAAQAKANIQTTPKFSTPEPVKETPQPEPTPEPQASQLQELSTMTVEELLNDSTPVYCAPIALQLPVVTKKPSLKIVDYSERSFAIVTDEKPGEETLNIFRLHGSYNPHLKCGKGWIFSKRHLQTVKDKLGIK